MISTLLPLAQAQIQAQAAPDSEIWIFPLAGTAALVALTLAILFLCLRVYWRLAGRVFRGGGKVWSAPLDLPDLLVAGVLSSWFLLMAGIGFARGPRPMSDSGLLQSALLFGIIVAAIALFLRSRKIPVLRLLGLRAVPPLRALGLGAFFFVAAYPLVRLCTILMAQWLGQHAESQEIIKFFTQAVSGGNPGQVWLLVAAAALVAPVVEEILFRGYFYGVLRRYLGPVAAVFLSAAFFAVIHVNLLSLVPLFVLAVCFALAYEATGSLLVPMTMHALFNLSNLAEIFYHVSRR